MSEISIYVVKHTPMVAFNGAPAIQPGTICWGGFANE